jgi:DNA-binding protein HU-beta
MMRSKLLGHNVKLVCLFKNPFAIGKNKHSELENSGPRITLEIIPAVRLVERRRMMTQTQVSTYLSDKVGITKKQAKSAVEELTTLVVRELKREGLLRLAGLGIFRKRKTKARIGRNPATGQQIKIPARTRLRFTPAKALKDSVLGAR